MAIERITPGTIEWDSFYANHIFRYEFAFEKLKALHQINLLDAACGVGYGANYLSKLNGSQITAIDSSDEALSAAEKNFKEDNIRFIKDDCLTLANAAKYGMYDVIVSFETLEHLPFPEKFLKQSFENLNTSGFLIVSTPNQLVSSPDNILNWAYHEKEYTASAFFNLLLSAGFKNIQLYGQQFNQKGKIKNEIRADLNRLWSNPLVRVGRYLQKVFRGINFEPVLKETIDDFELISFKDSSDCDRLNLQGPFVLIAIAEK